MMQWDGDEVRIKIEVEAGAVLAWLKYATKSHLRP
jgi:hypothetical protein